MIIGKVRLSLYLSHPRLAHRSAQIENKVSFLRKCRKGGKKAICNSHQFSAYMAHMVSHAVTQNNLAAMPLSLESRRMTRWLRHCSNEDKRPFPDPGRLAESVTCNVVTDRRETKAGTREMWVPWGSGRRGERVSLYFFCYVVTVLQKAENHCEYRLSAVTESVTQPCRLRYKVTGHGVLLRDLRTLRRKKPRRLNIDLRP